jgi:FKBP-type peptidyl-prolyl cis-trans isomerase FkpA
MAMLALVAACQQPEPPKPPADPSSASQVSERDQRALYMLGVSLVRQYADLQMTGEDLRYVQAGMRDALLDGKRVKGSRLDPAKLEELRSRRSAARAVGEKEKARAFLEQAAREPGMVKTESGLLFRSLAEGTGPAPSKTDKVKVHFRALLADGSEFDSSARQGQPHEVQLDQTSRCWSEGLSRMKVGGRAKLVCASDLTYGDRGLDYKVPGGAATVFELELLEVLPTP